MTYNPLKRKLPWILAIAMSILFAVVIYLFSVVDYPGSGSLFFARIMDGLLRPMGWLIAPFVLLAVVLHSEVLVFFMATILQPILSGFIYGLLVGLLVCYILDGRKV